MSVSRQDVVDVVNFMSNIQHRLEREKFQRGREWEDERRGLFFSIGDSSTGGPFDTVFFRTESKDLARQVHADLLKGHVRNKRHEPKLSRTETVGGPPLYSVWFSIWYPYNPSR